MSRPSILINVMKHEYDREKTLYDLHVEPFTANNKLAFKFVADRRFI